MSNKELVVEILKTYGCSTAKEVANLAARKYGVQVTPSQVAGALRPLIATGDAASSKNGNNATVYWMNTTSWRSQVELNSLNNRFWS